MTNPPSTLKPINRHLSVLPHQKERETLAGVLLPEDYKPEEDRFISATVIDTADDCIEPLQNLRRAASAERVVIIDRKMVEEISLKGKNYYLILENYVVGIITPIVEDY